MTDASNDQTSVDPEISARTFWTVLGQRALGSTVITARGAKGRSGFLGLSAAHVSESPARMLVSVDIRTSALAAIQTSGAFAINYLPSGREDMASAFGGRGDAQGEERFAGAEWGELATGSPVLMSALGVFDCRVEEVLERDGVAIVIGRVEAARVLDGDAAPLVHFRGGYRP